VIIGEKSLNKLENYVGPMLAYFTDIRLNFNLVTWKLALCY